MNIENLQLINKSETSNTVLRFLSKSTAISNETNLESFMHFLNRKHIGVSPNDYYQLFKDLETMGVGALVPFNGKPQGKFIWHYSFKDVSDQILNPNKMVNIKSALEEQEEIEKEEKEMEPMKRRGRPKGSRNKPRDVLPSLSEESKEVIAARRPGRPRVIRRPSTQLSKDIIFMFTSSDGKSIPFHLSDAENLIKQVELIKSQIA
jgi:hypothetical protein